MFPANSGGPPVPSFQPDQNSSTALVAAVQSLNNIISKLQQTVAQVFPQAIGTSATAVAGAATLPANPVGFLSVVNPATGATVKIPYYS